MTLGTPSPSHDPEQQTSGVPVTRPTFAKTSPGGATTHSPTFAKVLVIGLVAAFLLSGLAFIVSAGGAKKETPQAPGTPAVPVASAATGLVTDSAPVAPAAAAVVPAVTPPSADAVAAVAPVTATNLDPNAVAPAGAETRGPASGTTADLADLLQDSPAPSASAAPIASIDPLASLDPLASIDPLASLDPNASLDPAASLLPGVDPAAIVELRMPFVPVINFWATQTAITRADLIAALEGDGPWDRVLIPTGDRAALEAALGITIANAVEEADPATIEKAVKAGKSKNLGLVRASDVTFRMRSLGIGDKQLFGNDRVGSMENWPLVASVQGPAGTAWNQKSTWTLVAGGDSFTDRGIYERVVNRNKGVDYPFDGGTARVTGHYCCGPFVDGYEVPSYKLAGPKGIVREMTKNADLAIANHESPIPDDWDFHLHGFFFSGKPALTEIFTRAGIDWMSLANNHIKDYGTDGIADTRKNMDRYGIKYSGAGKDLAQARDYSILTVKGVRIAIIPCTAIAPSIFATPTSGGGMPCKNRYIVPDIREAKTKADFVIVFPHWGVEYSRSPQIYQQNWANKWRKAGADLVLGAHSHVAGAIEEIDGMPVFYSMGNFIFDQNWRTETMESFLIEATFHGKELVQLRLHPYLSHDQAQPNFLDPAKDDGKALMKAVRRSSFVDW